MNTSSFADSAALDAALLPTCELDALRDRRDRLNAQQQRTDARQQHVAVALAPVEGARAPTLSPKKDGAAVVTRLAELGSHQQRQREQYLLRR